MSISLTITTYSPERCIGDQEINSKYLCIYCKSSSGLPLSQTQTLQTELRSTIFNNKFELNKDGTVKLYCSSFKQYNFQFVKLNDQQPNYVMIQDLGDKKFLAQNLKWYSSIPTGLTYLDFVFFINSPDLNKLNCLPIYAINSPICSNIRAIYRNVTLFGPNNLIVHKSGNEFGIPDSKDCILHWWNDMPTHCNARFYVIQKTDNSIVICTDGYVDDWYAFRLKVYGTPNGCGVGNFTIKIYHTSGKGNSIADASENETFIFEPFGNGYKIKTKCGEYIGPKAPKHSDDLKGGFKQSDACEFVFVADYARGHRPIEFKTDNLGIDSKSSSTSSTSSNNNVIVSDDSYYFVDGSNKTFKYKSMKGKASSKIELPQRLIDILKNSNNCKKLGAAEGTTYEQISLRTSDKPEYGKDLYVPNNIVFVESNLSTCPIQKFEFEKTIDKLVDKNKLISKFYEQMNNINMTYKNLKISTKQKNDDELTQPINFDITVDSDLNFDYLTNLDPEASSILIFMKNILANKFGVDNSDAKDLLFKSLTGSDVYESIGLKNNMDTDNNLDDFKNEFADKINQIIELIIKMIIEETDDSKVSELFKKLFVSDKQVNYYVMTTLLLPHIIKLFGINDLYDYIPSLKANTLLNNYDAKKSNTNYDNVVGLSNIPSPYVVENKTYGGDDMKQIDLWKYPLITASIDETKGKIVPTTTSDVGVNTLLTKHDNNTINYHETTMLSKLKNSNESKESELGENSTSYKLQTRQIYFEWNGDTLQGNPNLSSGMQCSGSGKKTKCESSTCDCQTRTPKYKHNIKLVITDDNGNKHTYDIKKVFGRYVMRESEEWKTWITEKGPLINNLNINNEIYNPDNGILIRNSKNHMYIRDGVKCGLRCNYDYGNMEVYQMYIYDNIGYICQQLYQAASYGVGKFTVGNDSYYICVKDLDALAKVNKTIYATNENGNGLSLEDVNKYLSQADFIYITKNSKKFTFKFGSLINNDDIKTIKSDSEYWPVNNTALKWYSATYAPLAHDIHVIDDRWLYICKHYFDINFNTIKNEFINEVYNCLLAKPELLLAYRIKRGYLPYAKKMLGTSKSWFNIECPIMTPMMYVPETTILPNNIYVGNPFIKPRQIQTNQGIVVSNVEFESSEANIDTCYESTFKKFGSIKSDIGAVPGIFIADDGNPEQLVKPDGNILIAVDVDANDQSGTLEKMADVGSIIAFNLNDDNFKSFAQIYGSNNDTALSQAYGEHLKTTKDLFFPFVYIVKKDNGDFELKYHTFNDGKLNYQLVYYSNAEGKISKGCTDLSYDIKKENGIYKFRFKKSLGGIAKKTNPFGRLTTNLNLA